MNQTCAQVMRAFGLGGQAFDLYEAERRLGWHVGEFSHYICFDGKTLTCLRFGGRCQCGMYLVAENKCGRAYKSVSFRVTESPDMTLFAESPIPIRPEVVCDPPP